LPPEGEEVAVVVEAAEVEAAEVVVLVEMGVGDCDDVFSMKHCARLRSLPLRE
jgi:hypothetical protein